MSYFCQIAREKLFGRWRQAHGGITSRIHVCNCIQICGLICGWLSIMFRGDEAWPLHMYQSTEQFSRSKEKRCLELDDSITAVREAVRQQLWQVAYKVPPFNEICGVCPRTGRTSSEKRGGLGPTAVNILAWYLNHKGTDFVSPR